MSAEPPACAVHYDLTGPAGAPVVVLSPSLGTNLSMWAPQVAQLAEHRRVLRYDLRGHGASPVPPGPYSLSALAADLLAVLDRLEIERVSLCGISLGGMLSIWIAAHAPERVERLALLCTSARLDPDGAYRTRAATVRETGMAKVADAVVARWFTPAFAAARPDLVGRFREMLLSIEPEGYASCCEAIAGLDLREELASVSAPTLVLSGADDPPHRPSMGA